MNKCIFKGRLVADPELKQTQSGIAVCRFKVAVDKYAKAGEQKQADFIPFTAWRNTAEFISKYFKKGQEILVEGSLHNSDYTKEDGTKMYGFDVQAERVEFCGSKSEQGGNSSAPSADIPDLSGFEDIISDGGVPF